MEDQEYFIFERYIGRSEKSDVVFIKLTSNSETTIENIMPVSLELAEQFSIGSPIAILNIVDRDGDFINFKKISPDTIFYLYISKMSQSDVSLTKKEDIVTISRIPLKVCKTVFGNGAVGKNSAIPIELHFVFEGWNDFINTRRVNSWNNKNYSDIVKEIATQSNFKNIEVSQIGNQPESTIQPYWSNLTMIRWLQERSYNPPNMKYESHYEFGVRLDGTFFFKSISDMFEEQKQNLKNGNIYVFRLEGQREVNKRTENVTFDNNQSNLSEIPVNFVEFSNIENYMDGVVQGAGGITSVNFDFENRKILNTKNVKYSDSKILQLSDAGAIHRDHQTTNMLFNGGRDIDSAKYSFSKMSNISNYIQDFTIKYNRIADISIGDIVEVIIPSDLYSIIPFNEAYSGFYIVNSVHMTMDFERNTQFTTLGLSRQGFNGKELISDGFVNSKNGRADLK